MHTEIGENRLNNKCKIVKKNDAKEICCCNPSCKKTLAFLIDSVKNEEVLYRLSIKCPFCNSKSYDFDVRGTLSWLMGEGVKIIDIIEDDKNNKIIWKTTR